VKVANMQARIYQLSKSATQSGSWNVDKWVLEFEPVPGRFIDNVMGWTGSVDMTQELVLKFESKEQAVNYADQHNIVYELQEPSKSVIIPKSYSQNFN
jgi:hypothetical protein